MKIPTMLEKMGNTVSNLKLEYLIASEKEFRFILIL